jgi:hypothetical protein
MTNKATARPSVHQVEEKNISKFELREVFCVNRKMFLSSDECFQYMNDQNLNIPVKRAMKKVMKSTQQPVLLKAGKKYSITHTNSMKRVHEYFGMENIHYRFQDLDLISDEYLNRCKVEELVEVEAFIAYGNMVNIDQRQIIEDAIGHVIPDWEEVPGTRELSGSFFQVMHRAFVTPQEKLIAEAALGKWRDENGDCR